MEIVGISHISAAVLIAEIGDITRFASSTKLARYTGCAPIPVYSSDKEHHRLHRGGNRRLNSVLYTAAIVQKRFHPNAQALGQRCRSTSMRWCRTRTTSTTPSVTRWNSVCDPATSSR
ncbi:IS110 family transposase [Nocardia sp. NBC_00403]|uniref:IS110 family transposase n=1 Tax=Nocardia sp. NBC_00403 TaxID=2975990 RepID=UPI002E1EDD46